MDFRHQEDRIFAMDPAGKLLAEVTFPISDGVANINRTFVDDSLRGQGVASQLLTAAVEQIRAASQKVYPSCSYAIKWFSVHPEHSDLL